MKKRILQVFLMACFLTVSAVLAGCGKSSGDEELTIGYFNNVTHAQRSEEHTSELQSH